MNSKPNLEPSPELSYLLGVRYGDISLPLSEALTTDYRIRVQVKDKDFAEEVNYALNTVFEQEYKRVHQDKRGYWCVNISSKTFRDYLRLPFELHKLQIEYYPAEFLRGFFDSEGTVHYARPKANKKAPRITAVCTDREVLDYTKELLEKFFSINSVIRSPEYCKKRIGKSVILSDGRVVTATKILYTLRVYKLKDLTIFFYEIGFSIMRKQTKLEVGLSVLP
jgi:hypothetical protein